MRRTFTLVDDLSRIVGRARADTTRDGETVEYGFRMPDGAFFVEGRARLRVVRYLRGHGERPRFREIQ